MLAIAFEGCACRAAFHAGVAAALAERALPIALTAGASSGSLIAVGLVASLPLEALVERGAREVIAVTTRTDGTALKTPWRRNWRPRVDARFDPSARVRVHVIHPRTPLAIRSWDFSPDAIARAID